jgi:predicted restriction endonuclease
MEFIDREGIFKRPRVSKVYVFCDGASPDSSPAENENKAKALDEKSDSSSIRSGQGEFSESITRRDNRSCVFCGTNSEGLLEAAHYLPVKQKSLLMDSAQCVRYIYSIIYTANGILLCRYCHKCFDANLVCIDAETGKLQIAEALLTNEPEKWKDLLDRVVPATLDRNL